MLMPAITRLCSPLTVIETVPSLWGKVEFSVLDFARAERVKDGA